MAKNAKKTQQMKHEGMVEILRYFYCSFWLLIAITVYNSYTNQNNLYITQQRFALVSLGYLRVLIIRTSQRGERYRIWGVEKERGEVTIVDPDSYSSHSPWSHRPEQALKTLTRMKHKFFAELRCGIACRKLKYIKKRIEVLLKVDYKIACVAPRAYRRRKLSSQPS